MSARSYLYVPGDRRDMLDKADTRGADALIADLEDAVAPSRKADARATVAAWLRARPAGGAPVWVRVNAGAEQEADLAMLRGAAIAGIVVPKVGAPGDVAAAAATGSPVCALVETAAGVLGVREIAAAPGVVRLAIGEADLGAELGMEAGSDAWSAVRMQVVLASSAAGIDAPVASVSTEIGNDGALRGTTTALRDMGFGARAAIHPAQVPVINEVFTPDADEIARATGLLRAAAAHGGGAFRAHGRMVDEAVLRTARRTLRRAGIAPESVEAAEQT